MAMKSETGAAMPEQTAVMPEQRAMMPEQVIGWVQKIKAYMDTVTGDVKQALDALLGGGAGTAADIQVLQTRERDPGKPDYGIGTEETNGE